MMLGDRVAVMSAGHLEQLDSPEALYRAPASDFVADFLGTRCTLKGPLVHAYIPQPDGDSVSFRPHEVSLHGDGRGMPCEVTQRFYLGDHIRYELTLSDGQRFSAQAAPDSRWQPGDRVSATLDLPHPAHRCAPGARHPVTRHHGNLSC